MLDRALTACAPSRTLDAASEVKVGRARWNAFDRESEAWAGTTLTGPYNEKRAAANQCLARGGGRTGPLFPHAFTGLSHFLVKGPNVILLTVSQLNQKRHEKHSRAFDTIKFLLGKVTVVTF